jgi:transmembrane sensor
MSTTREPDSDNNTSAQAKRWLLLETNELSESQQREFAQWCEKDKANIQEYLRIKKLWDELDLVKEEILTQYSDDFKESRPSRNNTRPWIWAVAASIVVVLASVGVYRTGFNVAEEYVLLPPQTFSSATGQVKRLTLEDGSVIDLGPKSTVVVAFNTSQRSITLKYGEAFFNVAKDHSRPFVVNAAGAEIVAVGTQFNIYLGSQGATVTVHEGKVKVSPAERLHIGDASGAAAELQISDSVSYSARGGLTPVVSEDLSLNSAWREGVIVFKSKPLKDVVADLNRYHFKKVIITDKRLDNIEVNGVFNAGESDAILRAIRSSLPAEVIHHNHLVELRYKEASGS